jgi:hypothetical protein
MMGAVSSVWIHAQRYARAQSGLMRRSIIFQVVYGCLLRSPVLVEGISQHLTSAQERNVCLLHHLPTAGVHEDVP